MKKELNIVGHVVLDDKIFIDGELRYELKSQLGGPPSFSSMALANTKIKTQILTSIGKDFPNKYLEYFASFKNLEFKILESQFTTRFIHKIYGKERTLFIKGQAAKLDNYVQVFEGGNFCFISPVFNEISQDTFNWAKENHDLVALDVQGLMRDKDGTGMIIPNTKTNLLNKNLNQVNIVKFSLNEARNFTGKNNYSDILTALPKDNVQIVTMGDEGLIYSKNGEFFRLIAPKRKEIDPTGAGDVLMVSLLAKFKECDEFDYSLAYAMAIAAEKVRYEQIEPIKDSNFETIAEEILENKAKID